MEKQSTASAGNSTPTAEEKMNAMSRRNRRAARWHTRWAQGQLGLEPKWGRQRRRTGRPAHFAAWTGQATRG
jgi:hypothetical protein